MDIKCFPFAKKRRYKVKLFEEVKTHREHQAQTLYSANDYIKYTKGAENYVCSNPVLLDSFPDLAAAYNMSEKCRFELHDAPQLLKKEVQGLFPGNSTFSNPKNDLLMEELTPHPPTLTALLKKALAAVSRDLFS